MSIAQKWGTNNREALDALRQLAHLEGIICALEYAHAVAECIKRAPKMSSSDVVIVNISGRGDKDIGILWENLAL
jgi:tryptophan synthase beta chain